MKVGDTLWIGYRNDVKPPVAYEIEKVTPIYYHLAYKRKVLRADMSVKDAPGQRAFETLEAAQAYGDVVRLWNTFMEEIHKSRFSRPKHLTATEIKQMIAILKGPSDAK